MSLIQDSLKQIVRYRENGYALEGSYSDKEAITERYNVFIKTLSEQLAGKSFYDLTPACPMSVRQLIIAQHHNTVAELGYPNDQSVRGRNFYYATIGLVFTALARVMRVAVRTLGLPISLAVAAYQQHCYSPYMKADEFNIVVEDLRRVMWEWIDLCTVAYVLAVGIVNTLIPKAISTDSVRDYYIGRIDEARAKNETFNAARNVYNKNKENLQESWRKAQAIDVAPVKV